MDNHGASFYTFLANPDFTSEMRVPSEFVKAYGEILHPKIELKSDYQTGKSWKVETERVGKRCFLTKGWRKFAEDVGLIHGDCVVFTFLGDFAFNVSIYGDSSCKKKLPHTGEDSGNSEGEEDDGGQEMEPERIWKFSKEVNNYSFSRMNIPKHFAMGTGIAASRKMQLLDGRGRKWPIRVTDSNRETYAMTGGFTDFMRANKVAIGSTISFESIPNSDYAVEALVIPTKKIKGEGFR